MNPPLLPQPAAQTCSHCGAAVGEGVLLCPNCGASLSTAPQNGCLIIGVQLGLGCLALVFALGGACFVFLSGIGVSSTTSSPTFSEVAPYIGCGLLGVALAAACVWGIIRLGKRR